jgi:hypothetical protein
MKPADDVRGAWLRATVYCVLAACAVILAALQLAHARTP